MQPAGLGRGPGQWPGLSLLSPPCPSLCLGLPSRSGACASHRNSLNLGFLARKVRQMPRASRVYGEAHVRSYVEGFSDRADGVVDKGEQPLLGGGVDVITIIIVLLQKLPLPSGGRAPQPPSSSSSLRGLEGTWGRGRWAAAKAEATRPLRLG